jgi:hypothetical protein
VQWPLFVCLVYNPLIMDHLVAARGYSLAAALLLAMIAIAAGDRPPVRIAAACSVCAALSFAANFSFAFAGAALLAFIMLWLLRRTERKKYLRLAAAGILPALAVSLFLTLPLVLVWPEGQLSFGAHKMSVTLRTVIRDSLYELNPHLVNPLVRPALVWVSGRLFPLLGLALAGQIVVVLLNRPVLRDPRAGQALALGAVTGGALVAALGLHGLAWRLFHLPMPLGRTAIYIVSLALL